MEQEPVPHIYVPEDPDDLRDGLIRGYHEHMARLCKAKEASDDER